MEFATLDLPAVLHLVISWRTNLSSVANMVADFFASKGIFKSIFLFTSCAKNSSQTSSQ